MSRGCYINMASNLGASVTARFSLPLHDSLPSTWPLLHDFSPQHLDFSSLSGLSYALTLYFDLHLVLHYCVCYSLFLIHSLYTANYLH